MGGDHAGLALQSVIVRDSRGPSGHRSHLPRRSRSGHPRGRHYLAPARVAPEAGASPVGLLTGWPRFLPLGIWVTVLFLYARLARFEEHRLAERFGDDYLLEALPHAGIADSGLEDIRHPRFRLRPGAHAALGNRA